MIQIMGKQYLIPIVLLTTQLCFALPTDKNQPLNVRAHSADINQETHLGTFSDHVNMDQGSTHLRASHATTKFNHHKLISAIAQGSTTEQAHFWTLSDEKKPPLHAYANTISYFPEKHLIELVGRAHVEQGTDSFSAPIIHYDTLHQHVLSKSNGQEQTLIVIHPENHHE